MACINGVDLFSTILEKPSLVCVDMSRGLFGLKTLPDPAFSHM